VHYLKGWGATVRIGYFGPYFAVFVVIFVPSVDGKKGKLHNFVMFFKAKKPSA